MGRTIRSPRLTHQRNTGNNMKIRESKLRGVIAECFTEVLNEALYPFNDPMQDYIKEKTGSTAVDTVEEKNDTFKNNDPNYTHYLVNKETGKIVFGWDYRNVSPEDRLYYTKIDLKDNGFDLKNYSFISKQAVLRSGINPDDNDAWANS